jgi:hypothetical protein
MLLLLSGVIFVADVQERPALRNAAHATGLGDLMWDPGRQPHRVALYRGPILTLALR